MAKIRLVLICAGAICGGIVGSGFGIAGFFGAIAGTIPLAIIGAYIGWRISKAITSKSE